MVAHSFLSDLQDSLAEIFKKRSDFLIRPPVKYSLIGCKLDADLKFSNTTLTLD